MLNYMNISRKLLTTCNNCVKHRFFTTSPLVFANPKWREERGLPRNPNAHGVLTDGLDYTFLDGRLTPYGVNQRNRILRERQIAQDIIDKTQEIDFAVERRKQLLVDEENRKQEILRNKLLPKGKEMLKRKK